MMWFRSILFVLCTIAVLTGCEKTQAKPPNCEDISYDGAAYTVCRFDARADNIRLYLNDATAVPYGNFSKLANALEADNQTLIFAMNGGMYHQDRSPAGLYIEDGVQAQKINTNKGPGNFHLLPNGVFFIHDGGIAVMESAKYLLAKFPNVQYATQSGPMLVIDGKLHPKLDPISTSLNVRNGVGVDGDTVVFAISNEKVNFHSFAALFKNHLGTPNALFLDGSVSKLYAPDLKRNDSGTPMGPIIAVTGN